MEKHETRARIVRCAFELLGDSGADGFSASKLASAAGVSKATLFHHFRSVDEILVEAFDIWSCQLFAADPSEPKDLYDALTSLGKQTFDTVSRDQSFLRAFFVLLNKAMFDAQLNAKVEQLTGRAIEDLSIKIRPFVKSRGVAADLARTVLMQLDGACLHLLTLGNESEIKRSWKLFCQKLAK